MDHSSQAATREWDATLLMVLFNMNILPSAQNSHTLSYGGSPFFRLAWRWKGNRSIDFHKCTTLLVCPKRKTGSPCWALGLGPVIPCDRMLSGLRQRLRAGISLVGVRHDSRRAYNLVARHRAVFQVSQVPFHSYALAMLEETLVWLGIQKLDAKRAFLEPQVEGRYLWIPGHGKDILETQMAFLFSSLSCSLLATLTRKRGLWHSD